MKVCKLIYSDGRIIEVNPPTKWDLKRLQEFVGGFIEMVPSNIPHRSLIVNKDGLALELLHNPEATKMLNPRTLVLDMIRGNALLVLLVTS
jgi:hypothetical protein